MTSFTILKSGGKSVTICDSIPEFNALKTNATPDNTIEFSSKRAQENFEKIAALLIAENQTFSLLIDNECFGGREHNGYWYAKKPLSSDNIAQQATRLIGRYDNKLYIPKNLGGDAEMPTVFWGA